MARVQADLLEQPDDPRAVRAYGEWLQTTGNPHGELILQSLQAEAAELQFKSDFVPVTRARQRADDLIERHWYDWFGDLQPDAAERLTLKGAPHELRTWRDQLERSFPGVKLRPRLPAPEIDSIYFGPEATERPRYFGRGPPADPAAQNDDALFRFCAACAGEETTLVLRRAQVIGTDHHVMYEFHCRSCNHYTHYGLVRWTPEFPKPPRARRAHAALH